MYLKNFIMLLKRYTTSSLLNILGMAVAFAAVYIIMVQVNYDLSYNKAIPNAKNIYRLEYPHWAEEGYWSTTWARQLPDDLWGYSRRYMFFALGMPLLYERSKFTCTIMM